jgi:hypothetical protein
VPRTAYFSHRYGMISPERVVQYEPKVHNVSMQEDRTDRRARMRPPSWSQSDPEQTKPNRRTKPTLDAK